MPCNDLRSKCGDMKVVIQKFSVSNSESYQTQEGQPLGSVVESCPHLGIMMYSYRVLGYG